MSNLELEIDADEGIEEEVDESTIPVETDADLQALEGAE